MTAVLTRRAGERECTVCRGSGERVAAEDALSTACLDCSGSGVHPDDLSWRDLVSTIDVSIGSTVVIAILAGSIWLFAGGWELIDFARSAGSLSR